MLQVTQTKKTRQADQTIKKKIKKRGKKEGKNEMAKLVKSLLPLFR